jgi:tetratricopeptide (TPR) repeat protein
MEKDVDKNELPETSKQYASSINALTGKSSSQELYKQKEASFVYDTENQAPPESYKNDDLAASPIATNAIFEKSYNKEQREYKNSKNSIPKHIKRIITIICILFLLIIGSSLVFIYNTNAQIHYKLGNKYYNERKYNEAISHFTRSISLDINYLDSYLELGKLYNDMGNYDMALQFLNKALQISSLNIVAFMERGKAYFYLSDYQRAIDSFFDILIYEPNNELALLWRGKSYLYMNDTNKSLADFNQVIELNQNNAEVYAWLAFLYDKTGDNELYFEALNTAKKKDINISNIFYAIAELYFTHNKPEEAIDFYSKTLFLNDKDAMAFYKRGLLYGNKREFVKTFSDFSQAILLDNNIAFPILEYGETLIQDNSNEAITIFSIVSKYCITNNIVNVSLLQAMLKYAVLFSDNNMYDNVIDVCTDILVLFPDVSNAFNERGFAYLMLDKIKDAINDYTSSLKFESNNETSLAERGICYLITNQYREARSDFTKALQINADNNEVYRYRAILYDINNEIELAELDNIKSNRLVSVSTVHSEKINTKISNYIIIEITNNTNNMDESAKYHSVAVKYSINKERADKTMAQRHFEKALSFDLSKNYHEAIKEYEIAMSLDNTISSKELAKAYLYRSMSYNLPEISLNAIADYETAISLDSSISDSSIAQAYILRALSSNILKNYQEIINYYEIAISLDNTIINKQVARAYIARALSYTPSKDFTKAIYDIENAQRLDDIRSVKMGIYYFERAKMGIDYNSILQDYEKALSYDSSLRAIKSAGIARAYYQTARSYYDKNGNKDTAKSYLELAIEKYPGYYREAHTMLDDLSPRGGCFITTATLATLNKTDDCYELTMFRSFRDNWLAKKPEGKALIHEYYNTAPQIVCKINERTDRDNVYRTIWKDYLNPCLSLLEECRYTECKDAYIAMVQEINSKYNS